MSDATILVLGASGAVGRSLCHRLVEQGRSVAACARSYERLNDAVGMLDIPLLVADARSSEEVAAAIGEVAGAGRLGGIVNCAGSLLLKPAHATSEEEWEEVRRTNLDAAFWTVKHGAAALQRTGGGAIVLVSSAAASVGLPNHEAIAAAKAGVEGLTRSAAATYAPRKVRVNAVAPGLVRSGMTASVFASELALTASTAMHALGRPGEPDEIAAAAEWLLDAEWVTGQVLGVDGGLSRVRPRAKI